MSNNEKGKKWFKFIGVALILLLIIGSTADERLENKNKTTKNQKSDSIEKLEPEPEPEIETEIISNLTLEEVEGNNILATMETNVIDGSIFEFMIMSDDFDFPTEIIAVTIESGIGKYEFDIDDKFNLNDFSVRAMMLFDTKINPQPDHVKKAYGDNGKKITGEFVVDNNDDGFNIYTEAYTLNQPNKEVVKEDKEKLLTDALNDLINKSDGVLLNIQPRYNDEDWSSIAVFVGDAWYYTPEHEKERFAETMRNTITKIIHRSEKVESKRMVHVYFYDSYRKELAVPKGNEYKIKR